FKAIHDRNVPRHDGGIAEQPAPSAYSKPSEFVEALDDDTTALFIAPPNAKSSFRPALALTGLRRHEESHAILKSLPLSKNVVTWWLVEWPRVSMAALRPLVYVVVGAIVEDYIGTVEVRMARGKGRVLFLTPLVCEWELLLVEKAYAKSLAILDHSERLVIPTNGYSPERESQAEAVLKKSQERRIDLAPLCCLYDGLAPNTTIPSMSLVRTERSVTTDTMCTSKHDPDPRDFENECVSSFQGP
ncbi:hypothetical protein AaE_009253, partial [Aphanomyces astaci]